MKIIQNIILLTLVFVVGCSTNPIYTAEHVVYCEEGEYSLSSGMEEKIELKGSPAVSHITVIDEGRTCSSIAHFEEKKVVMGTEVTTTEINSCEQPCVKSLKDNYNKSLKYIHRACCS